MHNGPGQRVRKDNGSVTLFAYNEAGNLIGEYDAAGNAIREHVWFEGAPVAVIVGTDVHYVHTDHLGTPRAITDTGTVIWRWESDPFGSTAAQENPDGDLTTFTYNLRFPGQYYDSESGLHYNYFRTYDPSTGRYLESDPIGLDGGLNAYEYVSSTPLLLIDPFGLEPKSTVGGDDPGFDDIERTIRELEERLKDQSLSQRERSRIKRRLKELRRKKSKAQQHHYEACDDTCETAVTVVAVGGVAYLTYRCIRMVPSLFPPLWPTIPANLAVP